MDYLLTKKLTTTLSNVNNYVTSGRMPMGVHCNGAQERNLIIRIYKLYVICAIFSTSIGILWWCDICVTNVITAPGYDLRRL